MNHGAVDPDWLVDFENALRAPEPTRELRRKVADLVASGTDRDVAQAALEQLRAKLIEEDREADEDVVLEVLDFLTGWCSPHQRIE